MDKELFKNHADYWLVAENIRDIYLSDGSMATLLDFERVLNEMDIYAFKNWKLGELVKGPVIDKYTVSCTFMYPYKLMPDPRGGRRLLPFDCKIYYKLTEIKIPIKIESPADYRAGTHIAKLTTKPVWLVEIIIPKNLMADIKTGSIELEGQEIDLQELDDSYKDDLDTDQYKDNEQEQNAQNNMAQPQ